jgi:hypothetical protein
MEKVGEEAVTAYFNVLSRYTPGGIEEIQRYLY